MFEEKYPKVNKTRRQKVFESNSTKFKRLDINIVHLKVTHIIPQGELPSTSNDRINLVPNIGLGSRGNVSP